MNIFNKKSLKQLSVFISSALFSVSTFSLTELTDEEMTDISGQASLLSIDKYDYGGNNFYQVKVNSEVQSSINIDHLVLSDGAGNADIDITDLSISGGVNNSVTSATLTNPFVEFAFAGSIDSTNARSREIIGIRLGADNMSGVMSMGEQFANANNDTGINVFSGYMKTNDLAGTANTNAVVDQGDYQLQSAVSLIGFGGTLVMNDAHLSFPSISAAFTAPSVTINGTDLTTAPQIVTNPIDVDGVTYTATGSGDTTINVGFLIGGVTVQKDIVANGTMDNLTLIGKVTQDLTTIHRANIDSGFYLSAQNQTIDWRGSEAADIAQPGWWMGFNGEVVLDDINMAGVDIPPVTIQAILDEASAVLLADPITLSVADAFGGTVTKNGIDVDLSGASAVDLVLTNQNLGATQTHIVNCWNGSLGC